MTRARTVGIIGGLSVAGLVALSALRQAPQRQVVPSPSVSSVAPSSAPSSAQAWAPAAPQDPSLDPSALERAYPPAPADLPAKARPKASAIMPSEQAWRKAQREQGAVAY